ncbi:DUF1758 domain-containing protein [Nephila pilipes]|uniref:DUF1758 domain-containing protein n=1 Tax=Nephila pilipes TaxID=299642 RepID=A0A8X6TTS7_NEPPI|nr:DUF1758 domain-containing protein [Nephila pilipes]
MQLTKNPHSQIVKNFRICLTNSLGEEALSGIKGFAITEDNYKSPLKLLKDSFGQNAVFINVHISKLFNMTPLKNSRSERLNIYSFGAKNSRLQVSRKVEMKLRNILDGRELVVEALAIDKISRASIRIPDRDICAEMEYRELTLTFDFKELSSDCQISLLVGADY